MAQSLEVKNPEGESLDRMFQNYFNKRDNTDKSCLLKDDDLEHMYQDDQIQTNISRMINHSSRILQHAKCEEKRRSGLPERSFATTSGSRSEKKRDGCVQTNMSSSEDQEDPNILDTEFRYYRY